MKRADLSEFTDRSRSSSGRLSYRPVGPVAGHWEQ